MTITAEEGCLDAPIASLLDEMKEQNFYAEVTIRPHVSFGRPDPNRRCLLFKGKSLELSGLCYAGSHGLRVENLSTHRSGPNSVVTVTVRLPEMDTLEDEVANFITLTALTDDSTPTAAVTVDKLPELDFTPVAGPVVIDLKRVHAYARSGQVVGLREVALPGKGWSRTLDGIEWMEKGLSLNEQVRLAVDAGATAFNFAIKETDSTGRITYVYPDFGIREVTCTEAAIC